MRGPRIMVDACVDHAVYRALVQDGYDVELTPHHGRRESPLDPELIELSAAQGRVLVTDDLHIGAHFFTYTSAGGVHPGLIMMAKVWGVRRQIERVRHTLRSWDEDNMVNTYVWASDP